MSDATVPPPRSRHAVRQAWVERLQRFADAGLSVSQFCAAEGVSTAAFYSWKRRLAGPEPGTADPEAGARLLPVRLQAPAAVVELALPGGAVLRVPAGADAATLRSLLALLGVLPC
jgi:hypothetical protein